MSDCRRQWNREDELPVYLAGPISTGPNQRKSYGMFSSVEGAFESKTIDFDNYAVGRKGSRTPRSGSRERLLDTGDPIGKTPSEAREGSPTNSPGERDERRPGVEIRHSFGKESPDGKVELMILLLVLFFLFSRSGFLVDTFCLLCHDDAYYVQSQKTTIDYSWWRYCHI